MTNNENDFSFYTNSTNTPVIKNAAYYRSVAREKLKGFFWIVLLASLLAGLLGGVTNLSSGSVSLVEEPKVEFSYKVESPEDLNWDTIKGVIMAQYGITEEMLQTVITVFIAVMAMAFLFSLAFSLFVGAPVATGFQRFLLNLMDGKDVRVEVLFSAFKGCYGKSVILRILHGLIVFVASLPALLVVVGCIAGALVAKASLVTFLIVSMIGSLLCLPLSLIATVIEYRYFYAFTILAEHPEMSATDALRNSAKMMNGRKWKLFCLHFSFIGWHLLAILTCGIGEIFLLPYLHAANVAFYDDVTGRAAARENFAQTSAEDSEFREDSFNVGF